MGGFCLNKLLRALDHPEEMEEWERREETYDLACARSLSPDERKVYIEALRDHANCGDGRAALTLGEIDATDAIPDLERLAAGSDISVASMARRALVRLGQSASVASGLASDATTSASWVARFAAMMDLARVGGADAVAAAVRGLDDGDDMVRSRSFETLVSALGLESYTRTPSGGVELRSPLKRLDLLVGSTIRELAVVGADGLRDIVGKLSGGAAPESIGLVYETETSPEFAERFGRMLVDRTRPLALDEVIPLGGHDRAWTEAILAVGLERRDPRIPGALAALRASWTLPALSALANDDDKGFADAVREAKATLQTN
jgi:HEAT repeat protein